MALGLAGMEQGASPRSSLAPPGRPGALVNRILRLLVWISFALGGWIQIHGQPIAPSSTRLAVPPPPGETVSEPPLEIPLPAHATPVSSAQTTRGFRVIPGRNPPPSPAETASAEAVYLISSGEEKPSIQPENANLNLPQDLEITALDTGEKILLPAGTYRQILQIPIDSPTMQKAEMTRRDQSLPVEVPPQKSRYAEPEKKPIWVRYESLEKIRIGEAERRGGIDLPSHGPLHLGPRVWYAKAESADVGSSLFYFVFGGLGYSAANLTGWSAGNTREIPGDFEYRLIRR